MKIVKKIINVLLIIALMTPIFLSPYIALAEDKDNMTIKELTAELAKEEAALNENETQSKLTADEIVRIKNNINLLAGQIESANESIKNLRKEIDELQVKITEKDKEIKKVVNFLEISSGESEYLEYAFGAKTFTDFIYRMAITEQLTDYNDKLITEYNTMIENNKLKQEEQSKQIESLKIKQEESAKEQAKLETRASTLNTDRGDIKKGLESTKTILAELKAKGCRDDETASSCSMRVDGFPISHSGFIRPTATGYITSGFGMRWGAMHGGVDIGVGVGTPIYAVNSGIVTDTNDYGGTGMSIHIRHNVNGELYTSEYQHLSRYMVSPKQEVYRGQLIAYSGETGYCLGAHLHFQLMYGWAGIDYPIWGKQYYYMWFDPTTMIDF